MFSYRALVARPLLLRRSADSGLMAMGSKDDEVSGVRRSLGQKRPSHRCCSKCGLPSNDPADFFTTIAFLCIAIGSLLVCIGYLVPRDYVFDAEKPAREMEAIERSYNELAQQLTRTIISGMILATAGGAIIVGVLIYTLKKNSCGKPEEGLLLQADMDSIDNQTIKDYGSQKQHDAAID